MNCQPSLIHKNIIVQKLMAYMYALPDLFTCLIIKVPLSCNKCMLIVEGPGIIYNEHLCPHVDNEEELCCHKKKDSKFGS